MTIRVDDDQIRRLRRLMRAQIATLLLALVALAVGLANLNAKTSAIQTSRYDTRLGTCYLLRGLVHAAAPPGRQAIADAYIARTPLRDCRRYARGPGQ